MGALSDAYSVNIGFYPICRFHSGLLTPLYSFLLWAEDFSPDLLARFYFCCYTFCGTKTYCSPQCHSTSFPCPDFSLNTSTHSDFIVLSIRPRFRFTLRGNHILYSNCSNSYSVIATCPLSSVSAQAARFSRKMAIHPPPHPVSSLLFHSSPFSSCSHLTDV